jgi:hypothetical protein
VAKYLRNPICAVNQRAAIAPYLVGAEGKIRMIGAEWGADFAGRAMRFAAHGSMMSSQVAAAMAEFSQRRLVFMVAPFLKRQLITIYELM